MSFCTDSQLVSVVVERLSNSAAVPSKVSLCNRPSEVHLTLPNTIHSGSAGGAVFLVSQAIKLAVCTIRTGICCKDGDDLRTGSAVRA